MGMIATFPFIPSKYPNSYGIHIEVDVLEETAMSKLA